MRLNRIRVRIHSSRGVTLTEMIVAIGLLTFIFSFSAFMLVMMSRNAYNLNRQVRGQIAASNAAERATTLLRSAAYYAMWPGDDQEVGEEGVDPVVTRIRFAVPGAGNAVTTHVLCYNPRKLRLEYYDNENNVTFPDTDDEDRPIPAGAPTLKFGNVSNMVFNWESEYRVTLTIWYEYAGYALQASGQKRMQYGRFITDVIARRHFMDEGVQNYAQSDVSTSSPATL